MEINEHNHSYKSHYCI